MIHWDNEIMIDSTVFGPNELAGDAERVINEGLLYHEFLHGQLGIDWLKTPATVTAACGGNTPDPATHSDGGHTQIPALQDQYWINVTSLGGVDVRVVRPRLPAGGNGSFSVNIGTKNGAWSWSARVPGGGNVKNDYDVTNTNGKLVLTGNLADKTKEGHISCENLPASKGPKKPWGGAGSTAANSSATTET